MGNRPELAALDDRLSFARSSDSDLKWTVAPFVRESVWLPWTPRFIIAKINVAAVRAV